MAFQSRVTVLPKSISLSIGHIGKYHALIFMKNDNRFFKKLLKSKLSLSYQASRSRSRPIDSLFGVYTLRMTKKQSENNRLQRQARRKKMSSVVCLSDILLELMNERRVEAADIHKATGIPYSTLTGYIKNHVKAPLLDGNILALSKFFNCSINYLAFGIGEEPTPIEDSRTSDPTMRIVGID